MKPDKVTRVTDLINDSVRRFPDDSYLRYHAPRYRVLAGLMQGAYRVGGRILDIGRSRFTDIAFGTLKEPIDTLGFPPDSTTATGKHFHYDLNDSQTPALWRDDIGLYDIVIFAEVIEHLHTSPKLVLGFINSITALGGRVLLQTPNAVVLHKRLKMLLGMNPNEKIRENNRNPGHFREYTRQEIVEYAAGTGFRVDNFVSGNYFDYRFSGHAADPNARRPHLGLVNHFYTLCPGSLRPGMTFVLVKEANVVADERNTP